MVSKRRKRRQRGKRKEQLKREKKLMWERLKADPVKEQKKHFRGFGDAIRKATAHSIAQDIVDVQPMSEPVGEFFTIKYRYERDETTDNATEDQERTEEASRICSREEES